MKAKNGDRLSPVAREVLRYATANPEARGPAAHIALYWVGDPELSADVITGVLDELVERGLMKRHTGPDGRDTFQVDRSRRPRTRKMIGEESLTSHQSV